MPILLRCHPGIGPAVEGVALVARILALDWRRHRLGYCTR